MIVLCVLCGFFFFKQKTAYEMRISDWSSDVCSSDLAMLSDIGPDRRCGEAAQREDRLDDVQAVRAIEVITVPAARPQMPVAIEIVGNGELRVDLDPVVDHRIRLRREACAAPLDRGNAEFLDPPRDIGQGEALQPIERLPLGDENGRE